MSQNTYISQDGSCNGLQHYAALGRDYNGGKAVNLVPGPLPADVYTEISKVVQRRVEADAQDNNPLALVLRNDIDRKLVKQTVMTSVYGVTQVGAAHQVLSRLVERGWLDNSFSYKVARYGANVRGVVGVGCLALLLLCCSYAARMLLVCCSYAIHTLAQTTLAALEETFGNAKDIMNWLSDCAGRISAQDKIVEWTTPLGLPVMQPYRRKVRDAWVAVCLVLPACVCNNNGADVCTYGCRTLCVARLHHTPPCTLFCALFCAPQHDKSVRTVLQHITLSFPGKTDNNVIKARQRSAFPPNFVHSLDSSHMMKTAIACKQQGT